MFENQTIECFEKVLLNKKLFIFGAGKSGQKTIAYCKK